jgi:ferritin-like metal-binding protein YciE
MAGDQQDVREGLVRLIATVKEMASSINSDRQMSTLTQGSLGTTQAQLERMTQVVNDIGALMNATK